VHHHAQITRSDWVLFIFWLASRSSWSLYAQTLLVQYNQLSAIQEPWQLYVKTNMKIWMAGSLNEL
jgi:hypothetical protein